MVDHISPAQELIPVNVEKCFAGTEDSVSTVLSSAARSRNSSARIVSTRRNTKGTWKNTCCANIEIGHRWTMLSIPVESFNFSHISAQRCPKKLIPSFFFHRLWNCYHDWIFYLFGIFLLVILINTNLTKCRERVFAFYKWVDRQCRRVVSLSLWGFGEDTT